MNIPLTRKQLQEFNPKTMLREKVIEKSVQSITFLILKAASGAKPLSHYHWKVIDNHKLVIENVLLKGDFYINNPYTEGHEYFPDVLPDVIKILKKNFPDVDFRQDEIGSYLVVDWS